MLTFAFTLAVATGRVLLLDSRMSAPFYPLVFRPPFAPWLTDEAHLSNIFRHKSVHSFRGDVIDIAAKYHFRSEVLKCWEQSHSLSKCGLSQNVPVVKVQGIYDLSPALVKDHGLLFGLNSRIRHACIRRVLHIAARSKNDVGGATNHDSTSAPSSINSSDYSQVRCDDETCYLREHDIDFDKCWYTYKR